MNQSDEFYIGWEDKTAPGLGRTMRKAVVTLLLLALVAGLALAASQNTVGVSVFEWGKIKSFAGVVKSQPYPHLLVPRPGNVGSQVPCSSYYLVRPFKFGLDPETAARLDGKQVELKGTLIYRSGQTMIEVVDGSIKASDPSDKTAPAAPVPSAVRLGQQTFTGEIVDSKCFLGVMNPGALTPHRACAIRCIRGGIPPVLLVRKTDGTALYLLLVSPEGKPVNKQVLNFVAEPVEITGEVERQGELLILRADPATYRKL